MWRKVLTLGLGLALSIVIPAICCWSACSQSDIGGTWRFYAASGDGYVYGSLQVQSNGVIVSGTAFKYSDGSSRTVQGGQLNLSSVCIVTGHIHLSGGITVNITHGALESDKRCFGAAWKDSIGSAGIATGMRK